MQKRKIYIYGASGHGMVLADIAKACGYNAIQFIDDINHAYPNLNEIEISETADFIVAIGDNIIRKEKSELILKQGLHLVSLIHPSAIVSESASIGKGTVLMPQVVINARASVGEGVIVNTGCIVEHDCRIADYVHLSPNVALAGNVSVGEGTHIGIGSCVIQGIQIGSHSLIGAGSVVVKNVKDNSKAYGNPCREIQTKNIK